MSRWVHTALPQRLHFGAGALDRVADAVKEVGGRRVLLVTTEGRLASEAGERLVRKLGRNLTSTFARVRSHVPTTLVQAAVGQARMDGVDVVVSFGGGSCIDMAKAVCFFVEQEAGTPGVTYLDRPVLPHVSIPTTYSGAELTPFFGMTDEASKRKTGAGGPTIAPIAAIYDPELTLDTPVEVSAQTGMNALAHGVECAYSKHRTPEAEAIGLAAIRRISAALPFVIDDPASLPARTGMLEGAALAGRCLLNATMGVHHALSQLVGGRTGIPHGLANAIVLPHALRFNADAIGDAYTRIGVAMGDELDPPGAIERLRERIGLPGGLSDCGVDDDDIDAVVRQVSGHGLIASNPKPVTEDDARAILEAAF